ncbi:MAG: hypothetical protein Q9188_004921 [Gyalolechia gomerana]
MTSAGRDIEYSLSYYQSNLEPDVEMAISIQDQQRIFLAYRALFEGQNAGVRQAKSIRKILRSGRTLSSPLVQSLGFEKVVSVLKELLQRKVFSSELNAKLAFPVLYETSPEQEARHEASDEGAAKEEAQALQEVEALDDAVIDEDGAGVLEFEDSGFEEEGKLPAAVNGFGDPVLDSQHYPDAKQKPSTGIPPLYPVQFPFRVQNSILARSQKLLEECCYDFTEKNAANLLVEKRWDCAEAIELNKWTFTMMKRKGKLFAGAFKDSDSHINTTLLAVNRLRHSAVHRLRISAKGILQMIEAAVKFAETLSDVARASQLEELYKELQSMIKSQELNKNYLETKLKDELDEIKRQREELVKREQEAISTIVTEDGENTHFVGSLLERRLQSILDGYHTDEEIHESDPQDQLDNIEAEAEGADVNSYEEDSPEKQEPSNPAPNGITPSVENEDEETAEDTAKEGSMVNNEYTTAEQQEDDPAWEPHSEQVPITEATFAEPQPEETSSAEPTTTEPQAGITVDGVEVEIITGEDHPEEDSRSREPNVDTCTESEPPATEPPKQPVLQVSIAGIIQNILRGQEIDTASLRREKSKSKGKRHRKNYEAEMTRIKRVVAEHLRYELENDIFGDLIFEQIKEFMEE